MLVLLGVTGAILLDVKGRIGFYTFILISAGGNNRTNLVEVQGITLYISQGVFNWEVAGNYTWNCRLQWVSSSRSREGDKGRRGAF